MRRAELEHSRTIERLGDKFNQTLDEFQKLDATISDGEGVAVQIGGQLEQLDKQRQRAEEAMFLIQCYSDFSRGDSSRLEKLRKSGKTEDSIRCAIVARQLSIITKRLDASGTVDQTKELVEKFSETLEKDLLRQFDKAYRKSDWEMMRVSSPDIFWRALAESRRVARRCSQTLTVEGRSRKYSSTSTTSLSMLAIW